MDPLSALDQLLTQSAGPVLVCTGAGISLASGIPTFRGADPDAVWAKDVTELGTRRLFESDPAESWRFYLRRFDSLEGKKPNPGHYALVAIEQQLFARGVDFLLVTQNIDMLHEHAGSRALIKVHGSSASVRCSKTGCRNGAPGGSLRRSDQDFSSFLASGEAKDLPRCPACSSLLRPHVLWFDEQYVEHRSYAVDRALKAAKQARVMLFVGTSFSVGITAALLEYGVARAKVYSIDPGGLRPHRHVEVISMASEIALPILAEAQGKSRHVRSDSPA